MLCSCPRASASSLTLRGFWVSFSRAASRVGLARLVKNLWQRVVSPCFMFVPRRLIHLNNISYVGYFI